MTPRVSLRIGQWRVQHRRCAEYAIWRKCSRKVFKNGKNVLGHMTHYMRADGSSYWQWTDLSGREHPLPFGSMRTCLTGFIESRDWSGGQGV